MFHEEITSIFLGRLGVNGTAEFQRLQFSQTSAVWVTQLIWATQSSTGSNKTCWGNTLHRCDANLGYQGHVRQRPGYRAEVIKHSSTPLHYHWYTLLCAVQIAFTALWHKSFLIKDIWFLVITHRLVKGWDGTGPVKDIIEIHFQILDKKVMEEKQLSVPEYKNQSFVWQ